MRRKDKSNVIAEANQRLENEFLKSKGFLKENVNDIAEEIAKETEEKEKEFWYEFGTNYPVGDMTKESMVWNEWDLSGSDKDYMTVGQTMYDLDPNSIETGELGLSDLNDKKDKIEAFYDSKKGKYFGLKNNWTWSDLTDVSVAPAMGNDFYYFLQDEYGVYNRVEQNRIWRSFQSILSEILSKYPSTK